MDSGKGKAAGRKRERGGAEELKGAASVEGKGRAERRGRRFVGGYVMKEFPGYGVFLGKVVSFGAGLYKVCYEDGDCEELDYDELCRISVEKSEFDEGTMSRKKNLDQLVYSGKLINATPGGRTRRKAMVPYPALGDESPRSGFNSEPESMVVDRAEEVLSNGGIPGKKRKRQRLTDKAEAKAGTVLEDRQVELQSRSFTNFEIDSSVILKKTTSIPTSPCGPLVYADDGSRTFSDGRSEHCVDREADSFSDSCESEDPINGDTSPVDSEIILPPPPPLPPSSTDIDVPLESIAELFSVYNFLRSFSRQLFLSPFSFNEFLASLSFVSANCILDAVHVSLLRALKRHLETLSSKGNLLESRVLRHLDWSLLDTLTWPVFLAEYLLVSGTISKMKMKITGANFLDGEYYASTVSTKLRILQILCDDVVISGELMAELDMRAEKETLAENDADPSCPTEGSLTYACPQRANCPSLRLGSGCTVNSVYSSQNPSKTFSYSNSLDDKADMPAVDTENAVSDGNSDECCLCGMDGMLVCCDGCPSAYHSRCVGINKAYLPEGSWFCPECVVDKMGSTSSRIGRGLTGAELFGVDAYGRAYFGTCNYLLVLEDSLNQEPHWRYYNVDDIPAIFTSLCSSNQYSSMYSGICKGISQYWDVSPPMGKELNLVNNFASLGSQTKMEDVNRTAVFAEQNDLISTKMETDSYRNHMSEDLNTHKASLDHHYACNGSGGTVSSMGSLSRADLSGVQQSVGGTCEESVKKESVASEVRVHEAFDQFADDRQFQTPNPSHNKYQNLKVDHVTAGSVDLRTNGFHQYKQQEDKRPIMMESGTCSSGCEVQLTGDARNVKYITSGGPYQKVDFVPSAYTNQYIHGDIAASAAANLAIIAAEDNKSFSGNASSNPRKFASSNIALQMKAFLGAATYFFWPGLEKKSTEIPRDRCGWCISCQFYVNNSNYRKGCVLNAATLNSVKGVSKVLGGGPRPVKNNVGPIAAIAAYVLHIEESLHGLTTGPWLVAAFRRQWRKQVEQTSSCSKLKLLLLELEGNIRPVAFAGSWIKQADDWSAEASPKDKAAISVRPTQKNGPGRRGRRSSGASGSTYDSTESNSNDFHWWRGGSLSKQVLQKGVLPSVRAKKAARQGGFKRIPGVFYSESSEIPRRSRRIAWRSAVEMVKSISQLALQVRYLDAHIRWNDLHRPEQVPQDVKGAQSEIFAFSRVVLCSKAVLNNETRYMVDFGAQGDLPARILKNVTQADQGQDGKCRYWFSECHIPLYLIREYEEQARLNFTRKPVILSNRHQIKSITLHKDIFSYLIQKLDMPERLCCKQCQKDVLPKLVVKCGTCQGSFHKNCVMVTPLIGEESVTTVTCYACYGNEQNRNHIGQDYSGTGMFQRQMNNLTPPDYQLARPYMNSLVPAPFSSTKKRIEATAAQTRHLKSCKKLGDSSTFGLILKRNKTHNRPAVDFWNKNVLCGGKQGADTSTGPICSLCRKPYNSSLLYVRCEFCGKWFHGDAVGLVESLFNDVVGFKCCRCRKKCVPICPYADVQTKKRWKRNGKRGSSEEFLAAQELEEMPDITSGDHMISVDGTEAEDDPLLFSLGKVEPVFDQSFSGVSIFYNSGQAYRSPQKLPVKRRHIQENGYPDSSSLADASVYKEERESSMESTKVEWQFSGGSHCEDEGMMLGDNVVDCENTGIDDDVQYEPQTYFSLTELLASEGNEADNTTNMSMDATDNWHRYVSTLETNVVDAEGCLQPGISPDSSFLLAPCGICALSDPTPDVPCESCGFLVHSTCLPYAISEDGWKCGSCES